MQEESVTQLLASYRAGSQAAFDRLANMLYPELKVMARRRVNAGRGLGATTLVQETFLRLLSSGGLKPIDRQQFFGLAATIMRRIIIDDARYATASKRKGEALELNDDSVADPHVVQAEFLLQVDEALTRLSTRDPQLAQIFEFRYFGGYSSQETADLTGTSLRSVERYWSEARKEMAQALSDE